jgi:hypothetical protein
MKKFNKEEAMRLKPAVGRSTLVRAMVEQLEIGEALLITRDDWKAKDAPYRVVNYFAKKSGRKFKNGRMPDGTGWLVKRIA